ncbi:MAG: pantetheine-phosphate adenylyltransferase [Bilophila sp.]
MAQPSKRVVIYPGTFDPLTNGHANIIRRGLHMFDRVIVAVAADTSKSPLFTLEERVAMAETVFAKEPDIAVEPFCGLLVEYVARRNVRTILRGLRAVSDFEYEFQISLTNRKLRPDIETLFLVSDYRWLYISSTIVKTVSSLGGDVKGLVPDHVLHCLRSRFGMPHGRIDPVYLPPLPGLGTPEENNACDAVDPECPVVR